ncbi:GNAT family N-acetyltransferase [Roseovarius sp. LXJ103]|uniref:GNAT family N-acetyltransferase n=1 Tax=Roseovarius carneus TaxID=2853164 RepID=UPI000D61A606|nr:GNAT family N-acetyltransferase [Roseovarius carneus]MBZ8118239.1 GNAT family N-acetyltransferase [Roseovarius carneus]PWE36038.1 ribosomal-protein-alanine acetyltransferase [Pelagicola sp. LXJ1103]
MISPEAAARLHGLAFAGQGRGWRAAEFADLFTQRGVVCIGAAEGFALTRVIADEAELLTIAVDSGARRQGHARALLGRVEAAAADQGAARMFLEVAEDNAAARGLYAAVGYAETGRRIGYYERGAGRVDAVLMVKDLS